jgi:hypothetical protein
MPAEMPQGSTNSYLAQSKSNEGYHGKGFQVLCKDRAPGSFPPAAGVLVRVAGAWPAGR